MGSREYGYYSLRTAYYYLPRTATQTNILKNKFDDFRKTYFGPEHLGFLQVFGGPGGFRKLREVCRKNFHLVAPLISPVVTSYVHFCEKVNG